MKHYCVFGGQYGSEGKGAAAEWLIRTAREVNPTIRVAAIGENSPNSGHTCSLGSTRNLPASSYFAHVVILGPDAVIDMVALMSDLQKIRAVNPNVRVCVHENAASLYGSDKQAELAVVEAISSTGSGSGIARANKYYTRDPKRVTYGDSGAMTMLKALNVEVLSRHQYLLLVSQLTDWLVIFECGQGILLDTNWGIYPYVTSRSTSPRVAVERNGVGHLKWNYVGVYRTFPIRTGGPSGPTAGDETTFDKIGVLPEIATVTGRTRRVFEFSSEDFNLSLQLARPNVLMFTHVDYLATGPDADKFMNPSVGFTWRSSFYDWLNEVADEDTFKLEVLASMSPGNFEWIVSHSHTNQPVEIISYS